MLLNALVHRNYMGSMTQIRVYDHKISIWNEGILPEGMSLDALKRQHPSRPRNPIIADVCFKAGYIDSWGRGTIKIIDACKEAGLPEAQMNEEDGGFLVTLFKTGVELDMASQVIYFLREEPLSKSQIAQKLGKDKPTRYLNELMNKLLSDGVVEYTIPDKPNSRLQKYRLKKQ
jgi:predicted HTH transcriptional regulator